MEPSLDAAIDVVEAAYDLRVDATDWLSNVLRAGGELFDLGLGCYGTIAAGRSEQGVPLITQMAECPRANGVSMRVMEAAQEVGPDLVARASQAVRGKVYLLSETRERFPRAYEAITRHAGCTDILSMTAVDPDGCGAHISLVTSAPMELNKREREFWQMLEVHLATGHRLRRNLGQETNSPPVAMHEIPMSAEALLDPRHFTIEHAVGRAQEATEAKGIREAARSVDKARGPLRKQEPVEALRLWEALVRGKWTLVDWFDSDGRRFMLAKPNAPRVKDPRGLTEREAQVATYAAQGESSKLIGYRLGLSQSYVSRLLGDVMRKLGVKTQAQLVEKMRGIALREPPAA
jgi:DNA-binding CsgD family transcriptional regulator